MTDATEMPQYDGMEYEELVAAAQFMWMENEKLRELAKGACTVLRNHYKKEWFDGTVFAERMRELGIEVDA